MTSTTSPGDDFEAAKAVFEKLKDLPAERQERVLRWVAEGLGLSMGSVPSSTASSPSPLGQPPGVAGTYAAVAPAGHKDIKSFIAEKQPRTDNQFAAAVAYYYRFEAPPAQRRDTIDAAALQEATRLAGRARLKNASFTLKNAKTAGYVDAASRGEYTVNTVGENLVAMTLPGETATRPKTRPAASTRKAGRRRGR